METDTTNALKRLSLILAISLIVSVSGTPEPAQAAATLTIGVVHSSSSDNFSKGIPSHPYSQGTDVVGRQAAADQWVTNSGHTLVTVSDADLENLSFLNGLDVLILPYTWAMSENASLTVRDWVAGGGGLIPILSSPRVFLDGGEWRLWVEALNYEAWEWGPLSEAYQMMFVNDPTVPYWEATLWPGHSIVTDALGGLGLGSAKLTRPSPGSGVEFGQSYNGNVTSILQFGGMTGSNSQYNGFSAAQATHYGAGRVVYFDFSIIDFLPHYNATLAGINIGKGHDQGDLAAALLDAAADWAANGGGIGTIDRSATTWGEVDSWGSAIYVRQWVTNDGNAPVSGTLTAKIYNPAGTLVNSHQKSVLGIEPGKTHMYSWSYIKGSTLDNGQYRVLIEYTYSYPDYDDLSAAEALVVRSQGTGIPTSPVSAPPDEAWTGPELTPYIGEFDGAGGDDLALFDPATGKWWVLESGSSTPALWADFATASGWQARMVGDYNGDGKDDIAQFHPSNGTWWISRSTGNSFSTTMWADYSTASGWESRMTGDFNGDGRDDIAQFHPSNGTWWISVSTGSGFNTTLWADYSTASGWEAQMVGDYNGDGKDDIAQFHPSNGTWWISTSTGSGFNTTLWADYSTASGWTQRMTGDYDGDGKDDIAQFHPSNGTWWISRSTGNSFSTTMWADYSTASGWEARMTGDYNGDGKDDIAQFHPSNGTWWISISTGSGFNTTLWADYTTADGWQSRTTGDFDGNGRDDVAQFHPSNGTWWISKSTGSSFVTELWAAFTPS